MSSTTRGLVAYNSRATPFSGGGIYRHVTLNTAPAINIVPWSLYAPSVITGTVSSPQGSAGPQVASAALVTVNVEVQNSGPKSDSWGEDGVLGQHFCGA